MDSKGTPVSKEHCSSSNRTTSAVCWEIYRKLSFTILGAQSINQQLSKAKPTTRDFYRHQALSMLSGCTRHNWTALSVRTQGDWRLSCSTSSEHPSSRRPAGKNMPWMAIFLWWKFVKLPEHPDNGSTDISVLRKTQASCFQKSSKLLRFYMETIPPGKTITWLK